MKTSCVLFLIAYGLILSGCSVYKAASNEGVSVSDVCKCRTRGCLLSHGMEIIDRHKEKDGTYMETYRAVARKSGINYARAAGHGALDVMTLGLWEVVGTPVEGAISNNRGYITLRATYQYEGAEKIEKAEIYDANGNKVSN
ncbi:MAG TPA: hypothetical protein VJ201_09305 [Candidatus Babeliales bacterium]|nr:hypothetical protein [Candidatus Babeliales bacterium]